MANKLNQILQEPINARLEAVKKLEDLQVNYDNAKQALNDAQVAIQNAGNIPVKIAELNAEIAEIQGYMNQENPEEAQA